jgi:hypothetical protein
VNRPRSAVSLLLLAGAVLSGCGSAARQASAPSAAPAPPSLATAVDTAGGTWAVTVMGGPAAQHNNFWQLFARPAGSASWRLVTPPGVASNGGLVVAPLAGRSLVAGFRPSQKLVFTPLATTSDDGSAWSPGVLDAALADVPDALAADPGSGRLLALLADGTAQQSGPGGASWTTLASRRALAASAAGTRCGLQDLTAAAFGPSGTPLLAGSCAHPGTTGIFADADGAWRAAGPALPASVAGQPITVLRLTSMASGTTALLQAGTGPAASLLAAWSGRTGAPWALSPQLRLNGAAVTSASFGAGGAVAIVLAGSRGATITRAGNPWHALPPLPPGTATLAPGPGGGIDALAVRRTRLTIWQLAPGGAAWAQVQAINVRIQFGSSG